MQTTPRIVGHKIRRPLVGLASGVIALSGSVRIALIAGSKLAANTVTADPIAANAIPSQLITAPAVKI